MKPHGVKLALLPIALILAGCGGHKDSIQAGLDRAYVEGSLGAFEADSTVAKAVRLARDIRQARDDGVSDSWLSAQIDEAQSLGSSCDRCVSLLEDAR